MGNDVYEPLAAMILPHLGTKFCDLPDDVRQRVQREFIVEWDALSPERRTTVASQYDLQHDPAMEKENAYWWKLNIQIDELKNEIAKWDAKPEPVLPSESILKERTLDALRNGLAELENRWKLPPFSDSTQSQSQQPQPEQFKTPAAKANGPIATVSSQIREQTVIDALIIKIFRDAARRLLPFNPELGRQWEFDVYAAAFITDELREIWRTGAQNVDWQEIYNACENIVWEVWRRDEPMEKVPQSYLADTDAAPATLSLLPLNHSGHAKIEALPEMSATASVSDAEQIQVLRTGGKTQHSLSNRRHVLDSIVAMAIDASTDKSDYQAVWAAYVKIAKDDNRPPPLLGYVEGEGVKYASDTAKDCIAFDSKRAFASRFGRRLASR